MTNNAVPQVSGSAFSEFTRLRGILRIAEWCLAIIAFAAMANTDGFSYISQFDAVVGVNAFAFVWLIFIMVIYIFQTRVDACCSYTRFLEAVFDIAISVMLLAVSAAAAAKVADILNTQCVTGVDDTDPFSPRVIYGACPWPGQDKNGWPLSVAASFINFICFVLSSVVDVMALRGANSGPGYASKV